MNGRIFDPKTMTFAFGDGSGLVTDERRIGRELLKANIETFRVESQGKTDLVTKATEAHMIFKFLIFFSK